MKAFVLTDAGPLLRDIPRPVPDAGEILVRVRAAGLNRVDLGLARGMKHGLHGGVGVVLGSDWAGEIVEVGPGVGGFTPGQRVMGAGIGALAEFKTNDARYAVPMPNSMSFETAGCATVGLMTMHDALMIAGRFGAGQTVLLQGASSGVGLLGMQIAKLKGAKLVIGSSTTPARRARLTEFGADLAIDSSDPNWVDAVLSATGGVGVDLVIDQVAGRWMNMNLAATRILGHIVNVGRLGGRHAEFDFDLHALRRITYTGVTFRTRSPEETERAIQTMYADLLPDLDAGRIRLPIDRSFALDEASDALAHMLANRHFGKIVVTP